MIIVHIINNLKSYLYDQNYVINFYNNQIYIFNYEELIKLTDTLIKIKFNDFFVDVIGNNFMVYKMTNKELLVKGIIDNVRFNR